jgi:hypothetical protein
VAIGMALLATQRFPDTAPVVLTVAVASTVMLETVGAVFTRIAIRRAANEHAVSIPALRKRGTKVIVISLCKVFGASLFVATTLLLVGVDRMVRYGPGRTSVTHCSQ